MSFLPKAAHGGPGDGPVRFPAQQSQQPGPARDDEGHDLPQVGVYLQIPHITKPGAVGQTDHLFIPQLFHAYIHMGAPSLCV